MYDTPADLGPFIECFERGAFRESIGRDEIFCFVGHDPTQVLGRESAGTLSVWEDDAGVLFEVMLPDTSYAHDLAESVRRGDVRGASMTFRVDPGGEEWTRPWGEKPYRTIRKATLLEVSPTAIPAYEDTEVILRSLPDPGAAERAAWRSQLLQWERDCKEV